MKLNIITLQDFKSKHPKRLVCDTDIDYARLSNLLYKLIIYQRIGDLTETEAKKIAINIALYMEDVVADTGVWRGFVCKMKSLYGKYLPFYDIDEKNYYLDEPNLQDVQYLIWQTLIDTRRGRVTNPETPALADLGLKLYTVLYEAFEQLPVNETLGNFFREASFMKDFYQQRDVLKWFYFSCYLTSNGHALQSVKTQGKEINTLLHVNGSTGFYTAECIAPYKAKTGPLALLPQEWLSMTLDCNDCKQEAQVVMDQKFISLAPFSIIQADKEKGFLLEGMDGEQIQVMPKNMGLPSQESYEQKVLMASFVKFGDEWYLNGDSSWGKDKDMFTALKEEYIKSKDDRHIEHYDQLIKENHGSKLFYFANLEEMKAFLSDKCNIGNMGAIDNIHLNKHADYTVFLKDKNSFLQFVPNIARCIKDEHNPLYDKAYASDHAFECLLSAEGALPRYLVEHHLLPDARLNSIHGKERGHQLAQDNLDFLARTVLNEIY